ncbi:hypothetical protein [Ramlibacter sp.]|uniref:hypothetical protein n=1 Tax=Ramlibacter sp. TaxID=1917967 RepID=UPI002FC66DCD
MHSTKLVYFVPLIDVTWASFAPLDESRGFPTGPLSMELCLQEAQRSAEFMHETTGGRFVYALHTGTYCRTGFYDEPFMSVWQAAARKGAEFVVHPHEEIAGKGTRYGDIVHMRQVTTDAIARLREAGIEPVGYRGGHYGYAAFMTGLLAELGLPMDFSAAPGFDRPDWEAAWKEAPFSAYYPAADDPCRAVKNGPVLEIPLGADGKGSSNENLLYLDFEGADIDSLAAIWDSVVDRARESGQPQFIHTLYHTISMSSAGMRDRFQRFVDYACGHGGAMVRPSELLEKFREVGQS